MGLRKDGCGRPIEYLESGTYLSHSLRFTNIFESYTPGGGPMFPEVDQ